MYSLVKFYVNGFWLKVCVKSLLLLLLLNNSTLTCIYLSIKCFDTVGWDLH